LPPSHGNIYNIFIYKKRRFCDELFSESVQKTKRNNHAQAENYTHQYWCLLYNNSGISVKYFSNIEWPVNAFYPYFEAPASSGLYSPKGATWRLESKEFFERKVSLS
jgi:hypothetical protein